ncbi:hypothetical protein [Geodermatophilus ruber]|uniref:Uncharacterized protein n=1 Tax=Geodermatophilus ruber TaxID=504800 RepID=A0A1I4IAX1_9ACTN|nr:hypothetical protein [Geodermatophilus ruber]SFL51425.1 hypothetical protein SAMN04488085_112131 [Geodermatophilus ruber]
MTPRAVRSTAVLALVLVLCACAQRGGPAAPRPSAPEGPGRLVLQIEHVGGFVTPEMLAGRLPLVSVYSDGRVIAQGPQIAIHPAPALPNLQVWRLDADGVQTVVDRALTAGVAETGDLGSPPVADVPSTRFTLVTDTGTSVREVAALLELPDEVSGDLSPEQRAARGELRGLLDVLTSPEESLGAAGPEAYRPDAVAAVVRPWAADPDPELVQPEVSWPGPGLPGEPLDQRLGLSCVTARGAEATAVLEAAGVANALTPWVAGDGTRWALTLRPLLPHETGCTALSGS